MSNQELPASKAGETTERKYEFGINYADYMVLIKNLLDVDERLVKKLELTDVRDSDDWARKRLVLEWVEAIG